MNLLYSLLVFNFLNADTKYKMCINVPFAQLSTGDCTLFSVFMGETG